jgi:molybdopterin-guanine dinucleotide biosynthesis protein A
LADPDFPVTAVVLCGGSGRRFEGKDKPLERLAGRPLVAHVLARLEGQVSSVVISANRNLEEYRRFGHPVVQDQVADRGPLAGLQAADSQLESGRVFVCPGDAPFVLTDLVERLQPALTSGADVVVPHDGVRRQHLFMLLERTMAEQVGEYLERGGRSVGGWLAELQVAEVPVTDPDAFTNVNTADELARAELLV